MAKRRSQRRLPTPPVDSRAAEVTTVFWMLSVATTLLCELPAVATRGYLYWRPEADGVAVVHGLTFFSALVIGAVSMLALPLVLKLRSEPPPRGVTAFAILVSIAPLVAVVARLLR